CSKCINVNLCTKCYMSDKHDVHHHFFRLQTPTDKINYELETKSKKIECSGAFVGSIVERGFDWSWDDQDGGPGSKGQVIEIQNWGSESSNSVAKVVWENNPTLSNVYRMGHKGKVDLKVRKPTSGGLYYKSHLPKLGN
ncbi:hypothetical protein HELRODRAFT_93069, partial [Helobdella robusta]|uniref:MIB/HERC2 domain-containing protein n=1 Tax=Helobdella robusta TaxID=6412 RepID=T1G8S5_HELRO